MTVSKDDILDDYARIRASVARVLRVAVLETDKFDIIADTARMIAPWLDNPYALPKDIRCVVGDVALMDTHPTKGRPFDGFLRKMRNKAVRIERNERPIAEQMASAWFSIYQVADNHDVVGLWLEDLLNPGRRIWLVAPNVTPRLTRDMTVAYRVFDGGSFHVGLGALTGVDDDMLEFALEERGEPTQVPLSVRFYRKLFSYPENR